MKKAIHFDVLIVYNGKLATSASNTSETIKTPFPINSRNQAYNAVYAYFLDICHKFSLKAAFTTSTDIIGSGFCRSFWQFKHKKWLKVKLACFSELIFDKFSPTRKNGKSRRQLLFSSAQIKPFNNPDLYNLFFDKQKTYNKLSSYSIPTISLTDNDLTSLRTACQDLARLIHHHPTSQDFSSDIIMKDRFGAGGRRVYRFKTGQFQSMLATIHKNTNISYIIQPYTKFDQGFSYHNCSASTDIRLIYLNGHIVQSYIRVAKPGEFRCNEHKGGLLTYLSLDQIPPKLVDKSNLIAKILDKKHSLFTLDFIISNSGNVYFLEGNTGPGLDWNVSIKKNVFEAKKLIRLVVKELLFRINSVTTPNLLSDLTPHSGNFLTTFTTPTRLHTYQSGFAKTISFNH